MDDDSERKIIDFKRQCLDYLNDVLGEIEALGDDTYLLNDEHLAALNIHTVEPLDVDQKAIDFGPRFFTPQYSLDQTRQKTSDFLAEHPDHRSHDSWRRKCRRGSWVGPFDDPDRTPDPEERHPLCTPQSCAASRLDWLLTAAGARYYAPWVESCHFGVWEKSEWVCMNEVDLVPGHMLNLPAHEPWDAPVGTPPRRYSFYVNKAILLQDSSSHKPHIGATVVDSTDFGAAEVLRSEVAAAIGLLKHQIRRGDFRQHHTLPAIVFSFQHDRFARITQFHFDGRFLTMRQSRLLDLRSDEPTADAYHMIRWIANRPIGDTEYGATTAGEERLGCGSDHDTNNGKLPIEVRGT